MKQFMPINYNSTTLQKNRGKRTMDVRMMMIFVFLCVLSASTAQKPDDNFDDYWKQYNDWNLDHSSVRFCWLFDGTISLVESGNEQHGYQCSARSDVWVENKHQAMEYCVSRIPYHIMNAEVNPAGGVFCTFQINLKCETGWYQILNKCYQSDDRTLVTYEQAEAKCKRAMSDSSFKPQLAVYYSHLSRFFKDMFFNKVWVNSPNLMIEYPDGNAQGALLVDSAHLYDVPPGSLMLFDPEDKLGLLCEYTPPMTMAEMYYMAKLYREIYPIHITKTGASFPTASYMTIQQKSLTKNKDGNFVETFNTENIRERCSSIGNILSVDSHPLASIQEEYDYVKKALTDHRFHLTSANKNDGCQKESYQDFDFSTGNSLSVYSTVKKTDDDYCNAFSFSFERSGRYPTMGAMRAPALCSLHSFSYEYGDCDAGWLTTKRSKTTKFCHYINTEKLVSHDFASSACSAMDAALTGFEHAEEFEYIRKEFKSGRQTHGHFWLGGVAPCKTDCSHPSYTASWDRGVSRNTAFFNSLPDKHYKRGQEGDNFISLRSDVMEFHTHADNWGSYYICGKYPKLIVKKNAITSVKQGV